MKSRFEPNREAATSLNGSLSLRSPTITDDEQSCPVWLRGDLQSHTYHSDAKGSPALLVKKRVPLGLISWP